MEEKVVIDKETLKALVVDNRLNILKLLGDKKYTQSELAELLQISKPSIKEHLDILEKSDLIKKEDTKRKWKYYHLTLKGKRLIKPKEVKVLFAFAINMVALFGTGIFIVKKFFSQTTEKVATFSSRAIPQADVAEIAIEETSIKAVDEAIVQATVAEPTISPFLIVIILALTLSAGVMLGFLLKKRSIIINKEQ